MLILPTGLSRRRFTQGLAGAATLACAPWTRAFSEQGHNGATQWRGRQFQLHIGEQPVNFTGKTRTATTLNQSLPAPTLRWKQGERVSLKVKNHLSVDTSIHWHGIILPYQMDGVPGFSFDGIQPGENFHYQFDLTQSGTYWYHSHSGFQEQTGLYGAIIIDPIEPEPFQYDRDYVILLSDWSDEDPNAIYHTLKKVSHYYNFNERTIADVLRDLREKGVRQTWQDRKMWNQMRMSDTDLSDVTGYTYSFLMNGKMPAEGWTGLFKKGERIRLRIINASAMTFFDLRIPGLPMQVVQADGQNVEPVTVDEMRIGVAETYDVIVQPASDCAYSIFAQALDRSGFARGTLTPDLSVHAPVPDMDPLPILGHTEMGMGHGDHGNHTRPMNTDQDETHHGHHNHAGHAPPADDHTALTHAPSEFHYGVDMRVATRQSMLDDPGVGLRDNGRRTLTYAMLQHLGPAPDCREPGREIHLHLTGNMSRYMWSFDGIPFASADPLLLKYGERVRFTLTNDTMMHHPIHLHGMWSDLVTGEPGFFPRKHTVIVKPAETLSYDVSADALGRWAYHCHLLYHMKAGMFREVRVTETEDA